MSPVVTSETQAYITTVGTDHTIRVPDNIPSGTRVAVVIVNPLDDAARKEHFDAVFAALRNVMMHGHDGSSAPSTDEIARLVKKARAARRAAVA